MEKNKKKEEKTNKDNFKIAYAIGLVTQIGITVSIVTLFFIGAGYYADKFLGTLPIFVILGSVIAFISSMYAVYRLVLPIMDKNKKKDNKVQKE